MPPPTPLVGIIGKTNVGKSTFFTALTLISTRIENRPFVTIEPNVGIGYVRKRCAHVELRLPYCNPRNSLCIKGNRFIPVKLMDVAGLIKGAHKGRGLGNKFMDDLRQADVLLLVVDMAGSTNEDGMPVKPGSYDPLEEIESIIYEVNEWFFSIIRRNWERLSRYLDTLPKDEMITALTRRVSGLSIRREHVAIALKESDLENKKPSTWSDDDLRRFAYKLREASKPIVIVANKMDVPEAQDNLKRVKNIIKDIPIIPVSSLYELALRRASKSGLIDYIPGDESFKIINEVKLTSKQKHALELISDFMKKFRGTGVQYALNFAVFNVLKMIVVYPVEDPRRLTDHDGNVLPDAYLVKEGTTALDLAYMVHSELGKGFLYAILAKDERRVGANYVLRDGDIVKVVSAMAKR